MWRCGFVGKPSLASSNEVSSFLRGGLAIVQEEPGDHRVVCHPDGAVHFWRLRRFSQRGRQAHLSGRVAAALMAKASELVTKLPAIEKIDVLAAKLPD